MHCAAFLWQFGWADATVFLSFFFFFFKYLFIWLLGVLTVACGISLKQSNSGGKSQGTAQTWVWIPPSAD